MKPPLVYIYTRVSTTDKGQTTENQVHPLMTYATNQGWVPKIIEEYQSATKHREAFEKIMQEVREGKVNILLIYKIDRIARSLPHFVQITMELRNHGVRLIIPSQGIDTDQNNPAAKMLMNMLAVIAEFEKELIRERIYAGLERAKREGKKAGPKPKVFDRLMVRELKAEGKSIREIAGIMNIGKGLVERTLKGD